MTNVMGQNMTFVRCGTSCPPPRITTSNSKPEVSGNVLTKDVDTVFRRDLTLFRHICCSGNPIFSQHWTAKYTIHYDPSDHRLLTIVTPWHSGSGGNDYETAS
jgi:hypothetical protein